LARHQSRRHHRCTAGCGKVYKSVRERDSHVRRNHYYPYTGY
jgi:hypothetical protein